MSDAYLVMNKIGEVSPAVVQDMFRRCLLAVNEVSPSAEIIDVQFGESTEELVGFALKASGPVAYETLLPMLPQLHGGHSAQLIVQLAKVTAGGTINPSELQVTYFRKELAVDSRFVIHTESCARLGHITTGIVVRSTCRRSKAANYEEALGLMQSLLAARRGN